MSLTRHHIQSVGLVVGPLLALLMFSLLPESYIDADGQAVAFGSGARATLAAMTWMAVWWLTEAIDISATALLPLAVFPLLGILPIGRATAPYASDLIFLFMGGFILALSMQRWGLDKRIALFTLRIVGSSQSRIIGGFMLVTAVLSMWVSNTATVAMMFPIALSVIDRIPGRNFALSLMLGLAYAASIGGIATIIGSPPNGILVQFMTLEYGRTISFAEWMLIGGPVTLIFLPLAWVLITWVLYPIGTAPMPEQDRSASMLFDDEYRRLGPVQRGEWVTMAVFFCTALLWIARPWLVQWGPIAGLSDAGIAMMAAMVLFVIPMGGATRTFAMDWATAARLPWGILILFGGGLSLAAAVQANDVAPFLGSLVTSLRGLPPLVLVLAVTTGVIFLTELTSNTATTATLVPVLAGMASGLDVAPEMLIIPATIAASCAFMMPVATPPNAIVFGSGHVTIAEMATAGFWLNLVGVVIVTAVAYLVVVPLLLAS